MMTRIDEAFNRLRAARRGGLITFLTAGDPTPEISLRIMRQLPGAGADLIELGMPFSDPMADGPAIQAASLRALAAGMTLPRVLDQVAAFRREDITTPVVLMGYFNPIFRYGVNRFLEDASRAGVDGLIVVDLPPEEDDELCEPAVQAGLNFIRLATPTTDDARLPAVLENTSGFVYYVSITGITGTRSAALEKIEQAVMRIKAASGLPVAVGFGIRTPEQVAETVRTADAAVVGSALVEQIARSIAADGTIADDVVERVVRAVGDLARPLRTHMAAAE